MKSRTKPALGVVPTAQVQISLPVQGVLQDIKHAFYGMCIQAADADVRVRPGGAVRRQERALCALNRARLGMTPLHLRKNEIPTVPLSPRHAKIAGRTASRARTLRQHSSASGSNHCTPKRAAVSLLRYQLSSA